MARIPFVDTHFHLHDMKRPELRYAWLEPDAVHPFLGNIDAIKAQQIKTLTSLRDSGALTPEEFETEKRRILDGR